MIFLSEFIGHDSRSKYLINKINFIKEAIELGIVELRYVPTGENIADVLTKSLDKESHAYFNLKGYGGLTARKNVTSGAVLKELSLRSEEDNLSVLKNEMTEDANGIQV